MTFECYFEYFDKMFYCSYYKSIIGFLALLQLQADLFCIVQHPILFATVQRK